MDEWRGGQSRNGIDGKIVGWREMIEATDRINHHRRKQIGDVVIASKHHHWWIRFVAPNSRCGSSTAPDHGTSALGTSDTVCDIPSAPRASARVSGSPFGQYVLRCSWYQK